jgi:NhaP-type Na+/H+ or K+/H+ antiporter
VVDLTVLAAVVFAFGLVSRRLEGTVLAPTDAALGQAVVSNPRVPVRVRQALNVEAGLNDGLSVPFLALLHGITAAPLSAVYARRVQGMVAGAPEKQGTVEAPTHVGSVPPGIQRGG